MILFGRIATAVRDERGAVVVFVALFFPVAILFMAYTIDAANWFGHKRHLQLQADAAVLATGPAFNACFNSTPDPGPVYQAAGLYGGVTQVVPPSGAAISTSPNPPYAKPYNPPYANTPQASLHALINSQTFYNQPSPVDSTTQQADPCSANPMMADVKLTETNLPWYFQALQVPYINAHARVELRQRAGGNNNLPLGVALSTPTTAEAYLIDEATGSQLQTCGTPTKLCFAQLTGDPSVNPETLSNANSPLPTTINAKNVGVRIAFAGPGIMLKGNMGSDCGQATVNCYDATGSNSNAGILHIQGWSASGTGSDANPLLRDMWLTTTTASDTCSDGYFSTPSSSCTIGVRVKVDFGTATPPTGAEVDAMVAGNGGNTNCYPLTFDSSSGYWLSQSAPPLGSNCPGSNNKNQKTGFISLNAGAGSTLPEIDLQVSDQKLGSSQVSFDSSNSGIQRSYTAASADSGPIQTAAVFENKSPTIAPLANSWQLTTSGNLTVQITIPSFVDTPPAPGAHLYTLQTNGNQTGGVSCDPRNQGNFKQQLIDGCSASYMKSPAYAQQQTVLCMDKDSTDAKLQGNWGILPNPPPWTCVQTFNGNRQGQVTSAFNTRFGGTCNNWPAVPGATLPANDPRVVTLFVVPYGANLSNGLTFYPVVTFADFYIAGWNGDNITATCSQPDAPAPGQDTVVGYFIKHVDPGIPSPNPCDSSITACTPALTQ